MADEQEHLFANDGSDWTSEREPDVNEAREDEKRIDEEAAEGDGFTGTNDVKLHWTSVEGSASKNG